MYKLFCLPEHDDGDSIVHDTLSKDKRIEIMIHVQVMKYGQYCHCGWRDRWGERSGIEREGGERGRGEREAESGKEVKSIIGLHRTLREEEKVVTKIPYSLDKLQVCSFGQTLVYYNILTSQTYMIKT